MLLGLTILLVLLAWTLGNTIARSTDQSTLETYTGRSLHIMLRVARCLYSKLSVQLSCAIALLRHFEVQPVLATQSPSGDAVAFTVAMTGQCSECGALLIGRNFVGLGRYRSYTARDMNNSNRRPLLRVRGDVG